MKIALVHDWLATLGCTWGRPFTDPSGGDTARIHKVAGDGPGLSAAIGATLPNDAFRYEAQVEDLVRRVPVARLTYDDPADGVSVLRDLEAAWRS